MFLKIFRVSSRDAKLWLRSRVLLFDETKYAKSRFVIALLVSELQDDFDNFSFSGIPCISIIIKPIENVKMVLFRM